MKKQSDSRYLTRRNFLKLGGGVLATMAGIRYVPELLPKSGGILQSARLLSPAQAQGIDHDIHLAATDGWIYLPGQVPIPGAPGQYYNPDNLAPYDQVPGDLFTTYMFGFRNVTGLDDMQVQDQRMKCQASAPMFWVDENQPYRLKLSNLGLHMRPDLTDDHTVHWHGFRNAYPVFDGEPHSGLAVPIGRSMILYYQPGDAGTYMYHCHFEETEHVHMGMTGAVFVRPAQDGNPYNYGGQTFTRFAYNDADGSTGFDREFVMTLTDVWAEAHWDDAHIQLPDWTDFKPEYFLMNGRVYPDTLEPPGGLTDPVSGDLLPPAAGLERLRYQPISSLVEANAGDAVLLRFINLSFQQYSMTLAGLKMRVVGADATLLRGRDGTDLSYLTNTIYIAVGQSYDAIFNAPSYQGPGPYDTYLLYNRDYNRLHNAGAPGYGGQMTEVRIYPPGTLGPQTEPNTNPHL
jgi:FtsP/CotA-like multicopper oxidase with cupredoxin domain